MKRIAINENGIHMVFEVRRDKVRLMHFSALPLDENTLVRQGEKDLYFPSEIQVTGRNRPSNWHGAKIVETSPGYEMKYLDFRDSRNDTGRKLEWETVHEETGLHLTMHYQFYDGIPVVHSWTEVTNCGTEAQGLEALSSFCLMGLGKEGLIRPDRKLRLSVPHHSWKREMHWNRYSFSDLGLTFTAGSDPEAESTQVFSVSNTGNWSTKEYLPMAYLEDTEAGVSLYWQIEHNGSWHWEISDYEGQYYLELGGPDELHNHWWKQLMPGETFVSVPACIGVETAGMDRAMAALTEYRRRIRRPNRDNEQLSVIFNDYMNCLSGDPTTQKELEMIPKAREAGCEYFVVDCGWYADGAWWDGVGEWLPSEKRFPGGFKEVMDAIRDAGMIPGAWLELEVMGVNCPLAKQLPDSWFFMRHGRRVCDKGRYQLDFRNAEVRDYAERVIDRMVNEYGVGYIKMDYNIEPGTGTDQQADSTGQGLLEHNRAYLAWIDHIFEKYPELVIENCSSGGMRTDYAMLARHSLQSTSDQTDYRQYATLAANAPAAVTPEQAAVWSYPLTDGDEEETIFNMVNAMLLRIHQSGHLVNLSPARFALVKEGIACYKSVRQDIRRAVPFWPLGLSSYGDSWVSLGLKAGNKNYIAVWRSDSGNDTCLLPISHLRGKDASVKCLYPQNAACRCAWHKESGELAVELPVNISARLFEVSANE